MSAAQKIAGARRSKKYQALTAPPLSLSDVAALAVLGFAVESAPAPEVAAAPHATPDTAPEVDLRVTRLVASRAYTQAEAEEAVRAMDGTPDGAQADEPASETPTDEAPEEPSGGDVEIVPPKPVHEELVTAHGLKWARGRVYVTPDATEAIVRVRKTGSPEIIQSSGVGHTTAVVLFRTESGEVAIQNLTTAD